MIKSNEVVDKFVKTLILWIIITTMFLPFLLIKKPLSDFMFIRSRIPESRISEVMTSVTLVKKSKGVRSRFRPWENQGFVCF